MTKRKRFFNALQIYIQMILSAVSIVSAIQQNHSLLESIIITLAIITNFIIYYFRNREKKQWKLE